MPCPATSVLGATSSCPCPGVSEDREGADGPGLCPLHLVRRLHPPSPPLLVGGVVSLWRPKGLWDAGVSEGCGAWGSWPPRPPRGSFTAAHLPRSIGAGQWRGAGPRMRVSQDGCAEGGGVGSPPPFRALLSPLPVRPPMRATHQEGAPPQEGRSPKPDAGSRREAPLLRSRLVLPADSAGLQQSDPQAGTRTGKSAWPRRGQEGPAAPSTHSGLSLTGSPAQRGSGWGAGPRESCSEQPACAARRGAVSCTRPRARVWGRRPTVPPPQSCFPESDV